MFRRSFAVAAVVGLGFVAEPAKADAFECPLASDLGTASAAADVDKLLPDGALLEQPEELESAVARLRQHGLSSDNIIDRLIAHYCPAVAVEAGLSDEEKTAKVRNFAQEVTALTLSADSS